MTDPSASTYIWAFVALIFCVCVGLFMYFVIDKEKKSIITFCTVIGMFAFVIVLILGGLNETNRAVKNRQEASRAEDPIITETVYNITGYSTGDKNIHVTYDENGELKTKTVSAEKVLFIEGNEDAIYFKNYTYAQNSSKDKVLVEKIIISK